jgi:uncharacterized membrane protein
MNQPWKFVLLLTGIFVAGGVTGAFIMVRVGREREAHRPMPEQWAPIQLKRLGERLDLKPEQLEQIQPIVRRNMDELKRLRSYAMSEGRTVYERMEREITEKLTPEQRTKFDQMNKEFRERTRKIMQDRQNRPPGGPGGPRPEHEPAPGEPGPKPPDGPPPEQTPGS